MATGLPPLAHLLHSDQNLDWVLGEGCVWTIFVGCAKCILYATFGLDLEIDGRYRYWYIGDCFSSADYWYWFRDWDQDFWILIFDTETETETDSISYADSELQKLRI